MNTNWHNARWELKNDIDEPLMTSGYWNELTKLVGQNDIMIFEINIC